MTIQQAAQSIYSDTTYGNGELSQDEVIDRAKRVLADFMREVLAAYDVHDELVLRGVGHLIARAMLEQHCHTDRIVREMFVAALEKEAGV
jgi:hypothetical protein